LFYRVRWRKALLRFSAACTALMQISGSRGQWPRCKMTFARSLFFPRGQARFTAATVNRRTSPTGPCTIIDGHGKILIQRVFRFQHAPTKPHGATDDGAGMEDEYRGVFDGWVGVGLPLILGRGAKRWGEKKTPKSLKVGGQDLWLGGPPPRGRCPTVCECALCLGHGPSKSAPSRLRGPPQFPALRESAGTETIML